MAIQPIISGQATAMAAARGGLLRAGAQAADAAGRIAAGASPLAGIPADVSAQAVLQAAAAAPDLAGAMVDLLQAKQAYAANAVVLRSADEMAGELLRRTA
jgi:flagellar hook protein FlgE